MSLHQYLIQLEKPNWSKTLKRSLSQKNHLKILAGKLQN